MTDPFTFCDAFTTAHEGGWSDDPQDPGKATNKGITLATLSEHEGHQATVQDLLDMTEATRIAICTVKYFRPLSCESLSQAVALMVYDFGFNDGIGTSARLLQGILGVKQDGNIGKITVAAANEVNQLELVSKLAVRQAAHYGTLATFARFGDGLLNRTCDRLSACQAVILQGATT